MPTLSCEKDGSPGFKWGPDGVCITYDPNSEISKIKARERRWQNGKKETRREMS